MKKLILICLFILSLFAYANSQELCLGKPVITWEEIGKDTYIILSDDMVIVKRYGIYHSIRWSVKPGISGFAQIYGGQNKKTSWFWDKKYTENSNLLTDLEIILVSFSMNLFGKTRIRFS